MKIAASDVSIMTEIVYSTAEHEILLSFNCDDQATLFDEWWRSKGLSTFLKWAAQRAAGGDDGTA